LLCQISPIYKNKIATIERIGVSLQKYTKHDKLDIIVFPEMSFTGYNFASNEDALPFSVRQNSGVDF
jgi:predicted amidohydrolase